MSNEAKITDPYTYLGLTLNPDGTLTRSSICQTTSPTPDPSTQIQVLSKDTPINPQHATWIRIFLPREALDHTKNNNKKLPLIVFIHGGGFISLSAASTFCHDFCFNLAAHLTAAVVSVEYRLAPEHRLPAAYDDAVEALRWIATASGEEPWLTEHVDFGQCYLMGGSAGGNIAYHMWPHVVGADLGELKIQGLILHQPYFGGIQRTESELRLAHNPGFPLCVNDLMWELSLPVGVDRDHEYCNPTVESALKRVDEMGTLGLKVLVYGCRGDPLVDRQIELVKLMESKGVRVVSNFIDGGYHGLEVVDLEKRDALFDAIKDFIVG